MNRHSARGNSQEGEIASSSFILVEPLGGTKNGSNTIDGSSSSSFDALALNSYREGADMTRAGCNVISHLSGSLQVNGMLMPAFQEQVAFANGGESLVETKDSDDVSKSVAIDSTDACRVSFNDDIMSAVIPTYNSTIKTCPGDAHDKKISMKTFQGSSERLPSSLTFLLILGDVGYGVTARKDFRRSQSSLVTSSTVLSPSFSNTRSSWSHQQQHRLQRFTEDQSLLFLQLRGGGSESNVNSNDNQISYETRRNQESSSSSPTLSYSASPEATLPPALSVKGGDDMAMRSFQLTSFRNRAVTAVLMMAFLGFLSYYFKEDGLIVFTILLQGFMFQEMTQVIGGTFTNPLSKWWWFVTAAIAWNGPKVMPWRGTLFQVVSYGMIMMSSIGITLQLNWQKKKTSDFREYIRQAAVVAISLVLVVLPTSFWIATLEEYGMVWIFIPALYMIINDTMAYVGGQLIGTHPLLPSISPKKTWEGFLVAALSTVGMAYLLGSHANKLFNSAESLATWYPLGKMDGMILAAFTSLVAPFGGFLGSIIKRAYGQKDFGAILPGHGGLVDRLDCQLIVAPAVYFYLNLLKFATDAAGSASMV
ncbi:phosphatidate cytidylyltransferase [Nitzschia inconspicua]|uniref:Phosphatidate cytidylyltransferase n=1 Tax=Nitzschia inconspicua TaxID=303405 RepID=A0A9K3Q0D5_9STRA|nr:phosphatidate cytidylyltransferase [Nitzschia inconspicua]